MIDCDKCGTPTEHPKTLAMEPSNQPGKVYPVGRYGPECFYIAAASVRQQGHKPMHPDTGREVYQRDRT